MAQRSVEILIGRLVTDEDLRRRFVNDPHQALQVMQQEGLMLTATEVDALLATPVGFWERVAARLDARLQKASLRRS